MIELNAIEYKAIEKKKDHMYLYGMRLRGFSPGCQPTEGLVMVCLDFDDDKYYDGVVYDRRLTDEELREYELDFIGEVEEIE